MLIIMVQYTKGLAHRFDWLQHKSDSNRSNGKKKKKNRL